MPIQMTTVYIVKYYSWFDEWGDSSDEGILGVFDTRAKAEKCIIDDKAKSEENNKHRGTDYEIDEKELQ